MLTGRLTIAISFSRSGSSPGAMSGSSSPIGRECTPGTKKPVTLKKWMTVLPTSVRSRSLVPGPSASNGAPSFQRQPVTALPRRTTVVSGGTTSSIALQKASKRSRRPRKASGSRCRASALRSGRLAVGRRWLRSYGQRPHVSATILMWSTFKRDAAAGDAGSTESDVGAVGAVMVPVISTLCPTCGFSVLTSPSSV